jgi:hypothetical protein
MNNPDWKISKLCTAALKRVVPKTTRKKIEVLQRSWAKAENLVEWEDNLKVATNKLEQDRAVLNHACAGAETLHQDLENTKMRCVNAERRSERCYKVATAWADCAEALAEALQGFCKMPKATRDKRRAAAKTTALREFRRLRGSIE